MSQTRQTPPYYSSQTQNSKIADEAKKLLVGDIDDIIPIKLNEIIEPWLGKGWNEFRMYDPQVAIEAYMGSLKSNNDIYEFTVTSNQNDMTIQLNYSKSPKCYATMIEIKLR